MIVPTYRTIFERRQAQLNPRSNGPLTDHGKLRTKRKRLRAQKKAARRSQR